MYKFRDIDIKCKQMATIEVVGAAALLPVSGGFTGHKMITHPKTMTRDPATPAAAIGCRSLVTRSADHAVLHFNGACCLKSIRAYWPASSSGTPSRRSKESERARTILKP